MKDREGIMKLEVSGKPKRDFRCKRNPRIEKVLREKWTKMVEKKRQERDSRKVRESLEDTERVTEELSRTGAWSRGLGKLD